MLILCSRLLGHVLLLVSLYAYKLYEVSFDQNYVSIDMIYVLYYVFIYLGDI